MPNDSQAISFDPVLEKSINNAIAEVEKTIPIFDKEGKKLWFKDKISKGFTITEILSKLKELNYDFSAAGNYLDNAYASRTKSEKALEEVTKLRTETETKKEEEKTGARLSWIVSAFGVAGAAAFSSYMIKRTIGEEVPELTATALPGGEILGTFMKGGWILAGAASGVGLLLLAFFIIEKTSKKKTSNGQPTIEAQRKVIEEELAKVQ